MSNNDQIHVEKTPRTSLLSINKNYAERQGSEGGALGLGVFGWGIFGSIGTSTFRTWNYTKPRYISTQYIQLFALRFRGIMHLNKT